MIENLQELSSMPIFADVGEETLASLAALLDEENYVEEQYIVREGDSADAVYVLRTGEVEIRKTISRDNEKYKVLAILDDGNIFGEMAVFGEKYRSADVVARKDTSLWKLDYSELFSILNNNPDVGVKVLQVIIKIMVDRIKSINSELVTLYELGRMMPNLNDLDSLSGFVFDQIMNVVKPAEIGYFAVYNVFNEEFDIYQRTDGIDVNSIDSSDPLAVWMLEHREHILVKDTALEMRFRDSFYLGQSFIASPFLYGNKLLGFIMLSNGSKKKAFGYNHLILISTVCTQVGEKINDLERKKDELLRQRLKQGRLSANI
jgi:CRP-like cAMP-binding protein